MSGLEALAIVGIISNFETLINGTVKVVTRGTSFCQDVKQLPKALADVQMVIALVFARSCGQIFLLYPKVMSRLMHLCRVAASTFGSKS
jgi:hypothetical protein